MKKEKIVKISMLSILMIATIVLTGCDNKRDLKTTAINSNKVEKKNEGIVKGIKNMLKNGAIIRCVTEENGEKWITYTNGKNFRGEGLIDGKKQNTLSIDGTIYTWNKTTKVGQKIDMKCLKQFQKKMGIENNMAETKVEENFSIERLDTEEKNGKVKCSPVTGIDFIVPSDVNFTDQCEVMKKQSEEIKKQMEGAKQQMQNFKQLNMK